MLAHFPDETQVRLEKHAGKCWRIFLHETQ